MHQLAHVVQHERVSTRTPRGLHQVFDREALHQIETHTQRHILAIQQAQTHTILSQILGVVQHGPLESEQQYELDECVHVRAQVDLLLSLVQIGHTTHTAHL
jgi:hypothetical protein